MSNGKIHYRGELAVFAAAMALIGALDAVRAEPPVVAAAAASLVSSAPAPAVAAPADAAPSPAAPIACGAPAEYAKLDLPLNRTARRLAGNQPITIVAVGSSSTAGAGASSPAATYPSRLKAELSQHFPGHAFTMHNRGVNGEEVTDMLARFDTAVVAERPDLVLWQVGTNSVLRDHPVKPHTHLLHEGVSRLKAIGADVVLIDPQFAPKVLAKHDAQAMVDLIALAAKQENVDLFHRFGVMRYWREVLKAAFASFLSSDELHMNDWSYSCVAKLLGSAIAEAATRPVASAAAQPPR